tara:strand:- start:355 stop:579 length:225 start_codon:yes stop_codon:yes gene_type:complete
VIEMANDDLMNETESENVIDTPIEEKYDVIYKCLRCGTENNNSELSVLPEIKCICGFRVFLKVRSPIVKEVKAI